MASIERSNSKSSQILNNHLHASCRASISMSTCFRTARGAPELKPLFGRPSNLPNVRFPPKADIQVPEAIVVAWRAHALPMMKRRVQACETQSTAWILVEKLQLRPNGANPPGRYILFEM